MATIGQVHSISIWEIGVSKEELDPDMKIQSWHFKIKTDAHLPLKCSCLRKMALGIIIFMENKLPTCNFRQMYSILKNFLKKILLKNINNLISLLFNSSTYKHKNIDQTCYWTNADHMGTQK